LYSTKNVKKTAKAVYGIIMKKSTSKATV